MIERLHKKVQHSSAVNLWNRLITNNNSRGSFLDDMSFEEFEEHFTNPYKFHDTTWKKDNTVCFRVDMYYVKNGTEFTSLLKPSNWKMDIKNERWIPVTIAEQVWWWMEFKSKEDKEKYEEIVNELPYEFKCNWPGDETVKMAKDFYMKPTDEMWVNYTSEGGR